MDLPESIACLMAAGYQISKKRAPKGKTILGLNAVGKPYGPQYDPNYKMKYHTPKLKWSPANPRRQHQLYKKWIEQRDAAMQSPPQGRIQP